MSYYLVDYENVQYTGLTGLSGLRKTDKVVIFHNVNTRTIPFDIAVSLATSKAHIDFITTYKSAKNYLDFHIATYIGNLQGKGNKQIIYIISNDQGFNSVLDFWRIKKRKIELRPTIESTLVSTLRRRYPGMKSDLQMIATTNVDIDFVYESILLCDSLADLHNSLAHKFNNDTCTYIYKIARTVFNDYRK